MLETATNARADGDAIGQGSPRRCGAIRASSRVRTCRGGHDVRCSPAWRIRQGPHHRHAHLGSRVQRLGVGAAMAGMRPIVDTAFGVSTIIRPDGQPSRQDSLHVRRQMEGPDGLPPDDGATRRSAAQHSQSLHAAQPHSGPEASSASRRRMTRRSAVTTTPSSSSTQDQLPKVKAVPADDYIVPLGVADEAAGATSRSRPAAAGDGSPERSCSKETASTPKSRLVRWLLDRRCPSTWPVTSRCIIMDEDTAAWRGRRWPRRWLVCSTTDAPVTRPCAMVVPICSPPLEDTTVPNERDASRRSCVNEHDGELR